MNGLLFLIIALGVLAIVATIRELPNDGFRARPVDLALLQHLRDREERIERLAATPPTAADSLPAADTVSAADTAPAERASDRLASREHVATSRPRMRSVRSRRS